MLTHEVLNRINKVKQEKVKAIALLGSYARGEAGKYSDIDIIILTEDEDKTIIEFIDEKYLVLNYVLLDEVDSLFGDPAWTTANIMGLRSGKPLWDPNGYFLELQERANNFTWSNSLQQKANEFASRELVSWIEEVHKALQGLLFNDIGRMLNGIFGLTFGLFTVIRVQKGILLTGENTFYEQIVKQFGKESDFAILANEAFAINESSGIKSRAISGLRLFDLYTDMIMNDIVGESNREYIQLVKKEINEELNNIK